MYRSQIAAQLLAWVVTTAWIHAGLEPSLSIVTATASGGLYVVGHFGIGNTQTEIEELGLRVSGIVAAVVAALGVLLRWATHRLDRRRMLALVIPGLAVFAGLVSAVSRRYGLGGGGLAEFATVALAFGMTAGMSWAITAACAPSK